MQTLRQALELTKWILEILLDRRRKLVATSAENDFPNEDGAAFLEQINLYVKECNDGSRSCWIIRKGYYDTDTCLLIVEIVISQIL